jgi:hypothetical protein
MAQRQFSRLGPFPDDTDHRGRRFGASAPNIHPTLAPFRGMAGASHGVLGDIRSIRRATQGSSPNEDLSELRRQQAQFHRTLVELDKQNSWMAVPALAPAGIFLAAEGLEPLLARAATQILEHPLDLPERDPYRRVGDNWATRKGRLAHKDFAQKVNAKPHWVSETGLESGKPGSASLRPDAIINKKYNVELKPDTPTGRKAAVRAVKKYTEGTDRKTRAVFYDPKNYK